jgi:hypothetical protein
MKSCFSTDRHFKITERAVIDIIPVTGFHRWENGQNHGLTDSCINNNESLPAFIYIRLIYCSWKSAFLTKPPRGRLSSFGLALLTRI